MMPLTLIKCCAPLALLVAIATSNAFATSTEEVPSLPLLAEVGPWPSTSEMILYRDRLWFANAVLGVNHNSAEVHSIDLKSGTLRHERHLWSQAAGQPVVHHGLLYWPGEDPRLHGDWGAFQVTNGRAWTWGLIPGGGIFHVHAMANRGDRLLAAVSAWKAGLALSGDLGRSWQRTYTHPTAERRVSRITALHSLNERLIGDLREPGGRRLVVLRDNGLAALPQWPAGRRYSNLTAFEGWLYGLVFDERGVALWRSDGKVSEEVLPPHSEWRPRALASGDGHLWAVEADGKGGILWRSRDGRDWDAIWRLQGGTPREVLVGVEGVFVAGDGSNGLGRIWGRIEPIHPAAGDPPALPQLPDRTGTVTDWNAAGVELDALLRNAERYQGVGRDILRAVRRVALAEPPRGFFEARLATQRPSHPINPFGDVIVPERGSLGAFWLLWGMAVSGSGRVPPALISAPWTAPPNSAEKYFEPQLAAMWAVSVLGQDDRDTIDALVARLAEEDDPLWLRLDAAGALSSLVKNGHGTDIAAWRSWWRITRNSWANSASGEN